MGYWLLGIGYWLLAIGYWLLVMGVGFFEEQACVVTTKTKVVTHSVCDFALLRFVEGEIELNASTVKVSMTNTDYAKFSVRIARLPANQTLNCCGYVVENDKVTYLGHATTSDEAEIIDHAGVIELTK